MKKRPAPRKRKVAAAKPKAKKSPKKMAGKGRKVPESLLPVLKSAERNWSFNQPVTILNTAERNGCFVEFVNWLATKSQSGSLSESLAPEQFGFTLHERWKGLFSLYVKGKEVLVEIEPALAAVEAAVLRGRFTNHWDPKHQNAMKLEKSLGQMSFYSRVRNGDFLGLNEGGKRLLQQLALESVEMLNEALNPRLEELNAAIWTMQEYKQRCNAEKVHRRAEQAASDLRAVFKRACEGMISAAFHAKKRARGSGDARPKEFWAIRYAQMLCGYLRRLPTKTEVRERLEATGVKYPDNKNQRRAWREMFDRAGLGDLPD